MTALRLPLAAVLACLFLAACAGKQESGDGPSRSDITASDVIDAVPREEPLARYGNHSPYEVFGKTYHVMGSSAGYRERGIASWYGSKFHGRRTSSGEIYDMHLATAAHKSLPLPTYAEVTNLDNGRSVIVKINDRGPFKDDRLIDMSYGAALRLDMVRTGTARVEVRAIDGAVKRSGRQAGVQKSPGTWLQAGAYESEEGAEELLRSLERAKLLPVSIHDVGGLFRVWIGPFAGAAEVEAVIARAIELGFDRPHRVKP